MNSKNIKVVDEHNIDRDANVMFSVELEGSEYVVYWIKRDEESNNVFVSKVLKNIDGTNSMLNIDDSDKKEEVANVVKTLISSAVSDENDKLSGNTVTLSNGKVAKFVSVSFNKEQNINVQKTYITTVKAEVTKVAGTYYDVVQVVEAPKVEMPAVAPVVESVKVEETPIAPTPVVQVAPEVVSTPVVEAVTVAPVENVTIQPAVEPVVQNVAPAVVQPEVNVAQPTPSVVESITVAQPVVEPVAPTPVQVVTPTPVEVAPTVVAPQPVQPTVVAPSPVVPTPVVPATPEVVPTPAVETAQPLVFNASKETNLNAALGEVATSAAIPVENIQPVREFGVDAPISQPEVPTQQPGIAPMTQPEVSSEPLTLTKKAGFANSKFFMVVAVAFFLASCIFLGYEAFNYFQLVK